VSALLEGRPLPEAVARGNRIGALAIQVIGDSEGLPNRAELDALEQGDACALGVAGTHQKMPETQA
jgi:2-dehydro-3-deoxygluconokinase